MCDSLCALGRATATGVALFAKNSDRPPGEPQDVEWSPPRRDRGRVQATWIEVEPHPGDTLGVLGSRPRWQWGYEHGVNEAGLAIGNEAVYTTTNPRHAADALIGMDIVRLVLERATSVAEGIDVVAALLEQYGQGGPAHDGRAESYWSSFLLVDPVSAAVIDTDGDAFAVEPVATSRALSNQLSVDGFADTRALRSPVVDAVVTPRAIASRAFLERPALGIDDVRSHLRSHVGGPDGWTICMHADTSTTTASLLVELPTPGPRVAEVSFGHPCRSVFIPLVVGEPVDLPPWEAMASLEVPRDRLDAFEHDLRRDSSADPTWNAEAAERVRRLVAATGRSDAAPG